MKAEYPNNPSAVYGTMNNLKLMHGNQETEKGKQLQAKHDADMKKKKLAHALIQQSGK